MCLLEYWQQTLGEFIEYMNKQIKERVLLLVRRTSVYIVNVNAKPSV